MKSDSFALQPIQSIHASRACRLFLLIAVILALPNALRAGQVEDYFRRKASEFDTTVKGIEDKFKDDVHREIQALKLGIEQLKEDPSARPENVSSTLDSLEKGTFSFSTARSKLPILENYLRRVENQTASQSMRGLSWPCQFQREQAEDMMEFANLLTTHLEHMFNEMKTKTN